MAVILIVEDSVDDQEILKEFLNSIGLLFKTVSSGQDALQAVSEQKFDLIISDYHMDNGDGVWLIEKLKKINNPPRCILVTGEFRLGPEYFYDIGAAGFCYKPIIWSQLKSEIDRLL